MQEQTLNINFCLKIVLHTSVALYYVIAAVLVSLLNVSNIHNIDPPGLELGVDFIFSGSWCLVRILSSIDILIFVLINSKRYYTGASRLN